MRQPDICFFPRMYTMTLLTVNTKCNFSVRKNVRADATFRLQTTTFSVTKDHFFSKIRKKHLFSYLFELSYWITCAHTHIHDLVDKCMPPPPPPPHTNTHTLQVQQMTILNLQYFSVVKYFATAGQQLFVSRHLLTVIVQTATPNTSG